MSSNLENEERFKELRDKFPNSYFFDNPPKPMTDSQIEKFDPEDLQLVGYIPYREDYERVNYFNFFRYL